MRACGGPATAAQNHLLDQLTADFNRLDNKVRFVLEVVQGKLVVSNRRKQDLLEELAKRHFMKMPRSARKLAAKVAGNIDDEAEDGAGAAAENEAGDYDYLLSMPIWSLTLEKVDELKSEKAKKEAELNALLARSPKDLWTADLNAFEVAWKVTVDEHHRAPARGGWGPQNRAGRSLALELTRSRPSPATFGAFGGPWSRRNCKRTTRR